MTNAVRFPIRRKILFAVLLALTGVVSLITFTMARFFHQDKQAYINDWISIAAVSTAEDCDALLSGYAQRLQLLSEVMLNDDLSSDEKILLLGRFFDELPELVDIAIVAGEEEIETASDSTTLDSLGLDRNELLAFRAEHPIPFDRLRSEGYFVRNSTVNPELPTFTLALPRTGEALGEDGDGGTIVAVLRLDELLRVGSQYKVFEISIADSEGTVLAHPDRTRYLGRTEAHVVPGTESLHDETHAAMTREFNREGTEMLAGVAGVDLGNLTVSVVIPRSAAYLASRDLLARLLVVAFLLIVFVGLCSLLWAHRITRPVERLSQATRKIARGEFEVEVQVRSSDEIGALAGSFNQMATELHVREQALEVANSQLIQSEKLAAFGQLGAGIAHEVKNPLAGILGCAQLSLLELESGGDVTQNLQLIEKETKRCKDIIENLLRFARQEKAVLEPTSVTEVILDAAAIVNHQLEMTGVKLIKELADELPEIKGNANQLEQVLINLFINAQQAMAGEGTVTVRSRQLNDEQIEISVQDTGPGIPPDVQKKLFEPFFSTKPTGQGTGLGLSVSFGIVKDHQGEIEVISEEGNGAMFVLRFPVLKAMEEDAVITAESLAILEAEVSPTV